MPKAGGERGSLGNSGWMDGVRTSMIRKDLTEKDADDKELVPTVL